MNEQAILAKPKTLPFTSTHPNLLWFAVIVASLIGAGLALVATHPGGMILTQDSYHFIAGSRGFMTGQGFLRFNHLVTASWPPLYPMTLAVATRIADLFGGDVLNAARIFHAVCYGLTIFTASLLLMRYVRTQLFVALGVLSLLLGFSVLRDAMHMWTEGPYILVSALFFLQLPPFLEEKKPVQLAMLMLLALLGTMIRFGGVGLLLAGGLCILLLMRAGWVARFVYAAIFGLSGIPVVLWILYGYSLPYAWSSTQTDPMGTVIGNIERTVRTLHTWFFPVSVEGSIPGIVATIGVVVMVGWVIVDYVRNRPTAEKSATDNTQSVRHQPITIAIYITSLMAFLLIYMATTVNTPIDQRHMSIFYPFVLIVIFYALERLAARIQQNRLAYGALLAVMGLWFIHAAATTANQINVGVESCCEQADFRDLPIIHWLNDHSLPGEVYSNTPLPLLYTDLPVFTAPTQDEFGTSDWLQQVSDPSYLVWFTRPAEYGGPPGFYYEIAYPAELMAAGQLEEVATFDEGTIYRLIPQPDASASG